MSHICFSVRENCENLYDSYGEICVRCNCCGRFDESTKYEAQLELNKRLLQEQLDFNDWDRGGFEEIQRINIKANIEYHEAKIKELEENIRAKAEDKA